MNVLARRMDGSRGAEEGFERSPITSVADLAKGREAPEFGPN